MAHQVKAPLVQARKADGGYVHVYEGGFLPDDQDPVQLEQLLAGELVVEAKDPPKSVDGPLSPAKKAAPKKAAAKRPSSSGSSAPGGVVSVTLDEALEHLNIDDGSDFAEVDLYVDAANEWITERVSDTTPTPVKLAALFLIGHWWETQRGPIGTPVDDAESVTISGRAYAIPNRVLEILGPWLLDTTATPEGSFPDAVDWPDPVEWV